ncbi:MAG: hypothetical protein Q7U63_02770 [Polaromonas sp.]|uniref:hypothetical protein n=1 Tax=Polaromonas sp. TaxID=1869339 RepID=UPI0027264DFA|nr:hypothetical protein [Polaromonas sp.]MDO9112697.1 hypothetical protein [Polaromonas sp.]
MKPYPLLRRAAPLLLAATLLGLAGCDQLGIESPAAEAARREADGKAIGAACRHAARSVEMCFEINKRADRPAMFAGWREMNDYMRENSIEAMPAVPPVVTAADDSAEEAPTAKGGKATKKAN